MRMRPR